jgi:hypothetical protein
MTKVRALWLVRGIAVTIALFLTASQISPWNKAWQLYVGLSSMSVTTSNRAGGWAILFDWGDPFNWTGVSWTHADEDSSVQNRYAAEQAYFIGFSEHGNKQGIKVLLPIWSALLILLGVCVISEMRLRVFRASRAIQES